MPGENVRDSIWKNWVERQGNCDGCGAHDYGYSPSYGGGDLNSHVMVVLSDPNQSRDPVRTDRDAPKPKYESYRYGYSADNGWDSMEYLNDIAGEIDGCDDADDIYFTNAHKCPKLSGKGRSFGHQDWKSLRECREYITQEIHAVEPDVVLALSDPSRSAVGSSSAVEFDGSKNITEYVEEWVTTGKRYYGNNPSVVAGVHPSPIGQLNLNDDWYGDDRSEWYYSQVAKSVNAALSS